MALSSLPLLALAVAGVPLFAIIAASALFGYWQAEIDLLAIAVEIYRLAEMPVLLAIPLFTFAGYVLGESRAPQRLVGLSNALLGWLPGGLAIVAVAVCAFFTAFTGASGVTIVALGALLYPAMREAHYPEKFGLGLITSAGSLGLLFAPSLPLILYGVVAQQMSLDIPVNIDDLFRAGLLPGALMMLVLGSYCMWQGRQLPREDKTFSGAEALAAVKAAWPELPLPVLVLGGIYGGFLAVSEAAAVAAAYVLLVHVVLKREIGLKQLPAVMRESMTLVGGIMVILAVSLASTNVLIDAEVPQKLFEWIRSWIHSPSTFLLALTIFLLLLGMLLDIFSALVIVVPIILPIAMGYGIHPVHLGIVFLANMQLGYFTPPVGMNLFIASYRFNKPVMTLYRASIPFFFLLLGAVLLITWVPWLSLWWA